MYGLWWRSLRSQEFRVNNDAKGWNNGVSFGEVEQWKKGIACLWSTFVVASCFVVGFFPWNERVTERVLSCEFAAFSPNCLPSLLFALSRPFVERRVRK